MKKLRQNDLVIEKCDIPNIITPNGDNVNDYFYTHFASIYDDVNLIILNRWGKVVFEDSSYKTNGTAPTLREIR